MDVESHLIVAHEVINVGVDRRQLSPMAEQAKSVVAPDCSQPLQVIADQGYYRSEELQACERAGITAYVPKSDTSGKRKKDEFARSEFRYIPADDEYECPAGKRLIYRFTREENGKNIRRYWSSECVRCPVRSKCTPSKERRVSRWEYESVLEAAQARLAAYPDAMRIRRSVAEHPFGTLKAWMGANHFLTRTLANVSTEMSLHVLAYNMKRAIKLLGAKALAEAI